MRGGKRPGAGRPKLAKVRLGGTFEDPMDFLAAVMRSDACDPPLRVKAAAILLQA